ncbi:MAG: adenosylmethionine---8-amino-7-oxononanoate aminotransferase, partial [Solirubrobacteraceae bacterium]|nr:adenosylmethionine---8-amino-7-oxononanoate aminotransferase [Solirubrobacteraceae bacterium]
MEIEAPPVRLEATGAPDRAESRAPGSATERLTRLDRRHLWHPFTQQQGWADEPAPVIERAEGTTLVDTDGRSYIDGVSSLWCNVHGHRHPAIDAAVR